MHPTWKEAGLKPHRMERFMASDDPEFEFKAAAAFVVMNSLRQPTVDCLSESVTTHSSVILSERGPKRFSGVPKERFLLFGAELGGGESKDLRLSGYEIVETGF